MPHKLLSNHQWGAINTTLDKFIEEIKKIPQEEHELSLENVNTNCSNDTQLARGLSAIPEHIDTVSISHNSIIDRMELILKNVPDNVQFIKIDGKAFRKADLMPLILIEIEDNNLFIKELDLSSYFLYQQGKNLENCFKRITKDVNTLNLVGNHLSKMNIQDLVQGVKAIPATVTALKLANNSLEYLSESDLIQFHEALPDTITSINYGLISKPLFKGLKPSVKTVHIHSDYNNCLMIINEIPSTVDYIRINGGSSISLAHYKLLHNSDFYNQLTKIDRVTFGASNEVRTEWPTLRLKLESAAKTFLIDGSKEDFRQSCISAIAEAKDVFEAHSGLTKALYMLASIVVSICTLGFANYVTQRNPLKLFDIPRTASALSLDSVKEVIEKEFVVIQRKP